jgi:hypothetical protein
MEIILCPSSSIDEMQVKMHHLANNDCERMIFKSTELAIDRTSFCGKSNNNQDSIRQSSRTSPTQSTRRSANATRTTIG